MRWRSDEFFDHKDSLGKTSSLAIWDHQLGIRHAQPNSVTDNFGRKTVTLVAGCWLFHAAQSDKPELN
jgi:hypothetical protein